ncbi:MAG: hypothetical protein AMJ61_01030 [Desulfobacterales bacterium SG8_35_2]|jgi:hypothetical protein|nr:MAG: hypothetical protein AMJ61_01030 [Desulfobacterales bacterium SG8_35_2]
MEKIRLNYHLKLQEMCDCYMETDFHAAMQGMAEADSKDPEEDAIKYLALAIMYAITQKAEKLSFKKKGGELKVTIKNGSKEKLPVPPVAILDKVFVIMRTILHIEEEKGGMEFSLGLRSGEVNAMVNVVREEDKESLKIKFAQQ